MSKATAAPEVRFNVRLPQSLRDAADEAVSKHPVHTSRNRWIAEAICEKLEKEGVSHSSARSENA